MDMFSDRKSSYAYDRPSRTLIINDPWGKYQVHVPADMEALSRALDKHDIPGIVEQCEVLVVKMRAKLTRYRGDFARAHDIHGLELQLGAMQSFITSMKTQQALQSSTWHPPPLH